MGAFFEEVESVRESLREMEECITHIDQLYSRTMLDMGNSDIAGELATANDVVRRLTSSSRNRIKALQETTRICTHGQAEQERLARKAQTDSLKQK